jgi:hypothetical protein
MKQKFKNIALGLFLATVVSSCTENEPHLPESTNASSNKGAAIELGKKLENPYSVANMKKALANLRKSKLNAKMATDDIEITATHLYLKFTPKNEQELDLLQTDSTIVFYDHPLDYEIAVSGDYYRDPNIPEDQPTPLYCAVKVNTPIAQGNGKIKGNTKVMETVEKAILEELFIPDENFDTDENGTTNKTANPAMRKINGKMVSVALIEALVTEALRITNNLDKPSTQNKTAKTMDNSWRPAGRIRVWDDFIQDFIGVEGAQVRARRWFTTHRGWVGADGNYSCDGTFKRDANYSIDWDRNGVFHLQDGWLNGATYNGPKKEGNWDLNLRGDKQAYYATIYSGAYFFYYKPILGLSRPPGGLRIKARLENDVSSYVRAREIFLGSAISLKAYGRDSQFVFGTIIHELAHAQHHRLDGGSYQNVVFDAYTSPCAPSAESCDNPGPTGKNNRRFMETWAITVETVLTLERYSNVLKRPGFIYRDLNLQFRQIAFSGNNNYYTSAGFDMIDDINQRTIYGNLYPIDRVSGYNILQLQAALIGAKSWWEWRDNIKNKYNNPSEGNLDELFNNWTN